MSSAQTFGDPNGKKTLLDHIILVNQLLIKNWGVKGKILEVKVLDKNMTASQFLCLHQRPTFILVLRFS